LADALATNHYPLLDSTQAAKADLGDAAWKDLAVCRTEGRRLSWMSHLTAFGELALERVPNAFEH
jgi:hypothetical protein